MPRRKLAARNDNGGCEQGGWGHYGQRGCTLVKEVASDGN